MRFILNGIIVVLTLLMSKGCVSKSGYTYPKYSEKTIVPIDTALGFRQAVINNDEDLEAFFLSLKNSALKSHIVKSFSPNFNDYSYLFVRRKLEYVRYNEQEEAKRSVTNGIQKNIISLNLSL